jgi:hypothetical protein
VWSKKNNKLTRTRLAQKADNWQTKDQIHCSIGDICIEQEEPVADCPDCKAFSPFSPV